MNCELGPAREDMTPGSQTPSEETRHEPDRPQSATSEGPGLSREDQTTSIRRLRRLETFSHTEHR
jgi:hypothetical protein